MDARHGFGLVRWVLCLSVLAFLSVFHLTDRALAANGEVLSHQKISDTQGGFTGTMTGTGLFGCAVTNIQDLDGDGVIDVAVGAYLDDDGGTSRGAVWILFLNIDGTVKSHQKISDTKGGFTGTLDNGDHFGCSVSGLGDLDNDGIPDLAVGAYSDDDGHPDGGAVWILFLNSDGTVKLHQKISDTQGGFTGDLSGNRFGWALASMGDLDGDGVTDLAVGQATNNDGGDQRGAVWILRLNSDGTVKSHRKISDTAGGFTGTLTNGDWFGSSVAHLGDLDGDTVADLAVGSELNGRGSVWILFLNSNGTVKSHQKIDYTQGGFTGTLDPDDLFGCSVAAPGDLDCDSIPDLAVGALYDDDGGLNSGAVWILFLNSDGTVKSHQKISDTVGGFTGALDNEDHFGSSLASVGDLNGDDRSDLIVGAERDDDGGGDKGAVWVLFLDGCPPVPAALQRFDSYWTGSHVEVSWRLIDVEGDLTFEVARAAGSSGALVRVHDATVTNRGGAFIFEDHATVPGETYRYWVGIIENGVPVASFETSATAPSVGFALEQNHPNPFNPTTTISFSIDREQHVTLSVYNTSGRLVRTLVNRSMRAGTHAEEWDARDNGGNRVATGVYFYQLTAGSKTLTRKAVLLK